MSEDVEEMNVQSGEQTMDNDQNKSLPSVQVSLLGSFHFEWLVPGKGEIDAWLSRTSARSLFKLLLCAPDRQATRSQLAGTLWPETDEERARESLRSAIKVLRSVLYPQHGDNLLKSLPGEVLKLRGQEILWVDADAFEVLVRQASHARDPQEALSYWEQARVLMRGEFLVEEQNSEWINHRWAKVRRQTLRATRRQMVRSLADLYIQFGQEKQAEVLLYDHVTRFPIDQDALYRLMKLLIHAECFDEARSYYEQSKATLATLGKQPADHLKALEKYLMTQSHNVVEGWRIPQREHERTSTNNTKTTELVGANSLHSSNQQLTLNVDVAREIMETVHELERTTDLKSADIVKRRVVIAHLLGMPPALFSSDDHTVDILKNAMKYQEETLTSLYEDMLIMGWDSFRRSKSPQIITKIDEHVQKLTTLTHNASSGKSESWQSLLCRFSQLSTRIAQHRMNEQRALDMAKQAIMIAIDLDEAELIASTFYGRGRVHMEYSHTATDIVQKKRHFERAKADIDAALGHVTRVRIPLAGNIYLLAAEIYALIADNDTTLRTQCEKWQDKVTVFVENGPIEDDGTFLKLNPTALHHEKAKTLLRFGKIEEARRELNRAWETLQPNLFTWHMNMHLTQATLSLAQHEIEESAKSSRKAYMLAKTIHSHKGEVEAQRLFEHLQQRDEANSFIRDLKRTLRGDV